MVNFNVEYSLLTTRKLWQSCKICTGSKSVFLVGKIRIPFQLHFITNSTNLEFTLPPPTLSCNNFKSALNEKKFKDKKLESCYF